MLAISTLNLAALKADLPNFRLGNYKTAIRLIVFMTLLIPLIILHVQIVDFMVRLVEGCILIAFKISEYLLI